METWCQHLGLGATMAIGEFQVLVDDETIKLTIEEIDGETIVRSDERQWKADLQQFTGTNLVSLILNGISFEFLVDQRNNQYTILRGIDQYDVRVKALRSESAQLVDAITEGKITLECPLVGMILEIPVEQGQVVQKGDVLIIIEAMKMQNQIRAPRDSTILDIHVKKGDKVSLRQTLITLE